MIIPPGGVIDKSVLILVAQIFVLASSVYGFEVHFDIQKGRFHAGKVKDESPETENHK
jgi:hypothetical protein